MQIMECAKIAQLANGTIIGQRPYPSISSITIDSRQVEPGALFVALAGQAQDGHDFILEAFGQGATAALVASRHAHRIKARLGDQPKILIVVDDPLKALQRMAAAYVQMHNGIKKIGITGSCGKTTTKEMLASILSLVGKTAKTPGNMNSEIGLPISMFEIQNDTEFGIFEMGVDHVGEMDRMLNIWRPEVALITNIGLSHVGKMGSTQVIAKEKSKVFHPDVEEAFMIENSAWTPYIQKVRNIEARAYGMVGTKGLGRIVSLGLHGWQISYNGLLIHLHAVGKHNLMDAIAAISVAQVMGATTSQIADGLEQFSAVPGRSRIINGSVTVIEDWYNSSVDSTNTILDYMATLPWQGRKLAVLGSMKELGVATEDAHVHVAHKLLAANLDDVYLYGKEMEKAWMEMRKMGFTKNVFFTDDYDELQKRMITDTHKGDLILLKGSRAMAMERLIPVLTSIA